MVSNYDYKNSTKAKTTFGNTYGRKARIRKKSLAVSILKGIGVAGIVLLAARAGKNISMQPMARAEVFIGDAVFNAELVHTSALRERGLSGRESLSEGDGMLFIFPSAAKYGFWMKDMRFALDLIWIRDGKVIGITEEVPAPQGASDVLETYYPPDNVDMVFEVAAGTSRRKGMRIGDAVHVGGGAKLRP
mgnify:CR=1 FL=1